MLQEFKDFINRGNVVELAVAFVMGVAFKPIVDAVVNRVVMPTVGLLIGQPNFDTVGMFACEVGLDPAAGTAVGNQVCAGSVGAVLTAIVNFLLVALALFFVVRAYNRFQERTEEPAEEEVAEAEEIVLLREIRDSLGGRA